MKKHSILLGTLLCLSQLISAQVYPLRPKLSHERSFSMVLIPDPQSYVKFDANQPLFELQTAWIANSQRRTTKPSHPRDTLQLRASRIRTMQPEVIRPVLK